MTNSVDTSFYDTKDQEPDNPLKMIGDITAIKNAQQQNQLLQTSNKRAQVGLSAEQAALASKQYDSLNKITGDLVAKSQSPEGISQQEIIDAATNAAAAGIVTPAQVVNMIKTLPADTPQNNAQFVGMMQYKIQDAAKQHEVAYGRGVYGDNGAQQYYGVQNDPQYGGNMNIATAVNKTISPETGAQRVPAIVGGAPGSVPLSSLTNPDGTAKVTQNDGQEVPTATSPVNNVMPNPQAQTSAPRLPTGAVKSGFAPGEALDKEAQATQGVALQHLADTVPARKTLLNELDSIVKSGDVNFGPGSSQWKGVLSGVQRLYGGDSETVAKYDTFNKLATQLAQQQFQSLGGTGTDTKLGSAISASPNTSLSNKSNADIIALLKGNEDAIKVKNAEWQKWKTNNGAGDYAAFSSDFNNKFDPRVFQAQYMAPADKKAMIKQLSDKELSQYRKDYNAADANGWLK